MTAEKINLQENLIADMKQNKDKIIKQKQKLIDTNAEEIKSRVEEKVMIEQENTNLLNTITDRLQTEKKQEKLKQIRATLSEKVSTHEKMKTFFVENEDCPTCEQHIDENFKEDMIAKKDEEKEELEEGLSKLKTVLDGVFDRVGEIKKTTKIIADNQVSLAKINTSIKELEKFNVKLQTEIDQYTKDGVGINDTDKLTTLSKEYVEIAKQRTKLKETKVYYEAARSMLTDTGIKTKIIKQYLPIMNKLINKYLTSMEFYVNFTLDENFEETIKSRYRDEFSYASFSEGEKMRIDLALLFTWRAIAKMKNSTNCNLLMLDEIFDSSLDGTGTDEFLKILNTLSGENVFVISHKQDALADKFRETIRFEKIRNFSHVAT